MEDDTNKPVNYEGRPPEYTSEYRCPNCDRRLVFLATDRLHYCRACMQEFEAVELERKR